MTIDSLPVPAASDAEATPSDAEIDRLLGGPPVLPDRFWESRPVLRHIRQAARARVVAPDALLGAVLARLCVAIDWRLLLPAIVGRRGSLNISVALAGRSGAGKGSVIDESGELLDLPRIQAHRTGEAPAGSGEGIVRSFFEQVPDPDSDRKNAPKVWRQEREGVLIRVDEGELLRALGQRSGQTTDQILRQAWSGEALGGSYVGESGSRRLRAHSYRLALLIAVQPEVARFLFDAAAGGTPQRLLWLSASFDPGAPDVPPEHPGRIHLSAVPFSSMPADRRCKVADEWRAELQVRDSIWKELQREQVLIRRGEKELDPLDTHAGLSRLKTATLLAFLEGRPYVLPQDWDLAGVVALTSKAVRLWMAGVLGKAEAGRNRASAARAGERAEAAEVGAAKARAKLMRIAAVMGRHVHRKHPAGEKPCSRSCLNQAVASRDKEYLSGALGLAVERGWVSDTEGLLVPGDSVPAEAR